MRREEESLEIIVSGSKERSEVVYSTACSTGGGQQGGYYDPLVCLPAMERVHQHSIESSIVTEGHYDASFETEDFPPGDSFDVAGPGYGEENGRQVNNGHLGASRGGTSNGGGREGKGTKVGEGGPLAGTGEARLETLQPAALNIKSIPSEVELVQEGAGQEEGQPGPGVNKVLWKRVRHCVVFGVKKKNEKKQ
jgi:hypothetical protein